MSDRTDDLQELITATIAALGTEAQKPFEMEAYFEYVKTEDYEMDEICPRVKIIKR